MADQADLFGAPLRTQRHVRTFLKVDGRPSPAPAGLSFVEAARIDLGPCPASERQASFASDIPKGLGIPLPIGSDAAAVGSFIERHRRDYEETIRRARRRKG